ncbi:patatin-like phospholipase family protein [Bradyrhizobium sp. BR 1432]|uniref:patatin-like phospholipase family protein n=1 Tax=Bradyrhizobium sp. BR 1432 TaxID=3447966 RepID=UPI003EE6F44E
MNPERCLTAVVFSGGLGLGAHHGGVFEALTGLALSIVWVRGSSAGAIAAALIAGSSNADRLRNLRSRGHAARHLSSMHDRNSILELRQQMTN